MKQIFYLAVFFTLFAHPFIQGKEQTTYVYDKEIEGKHSKITWNLEEKDKDLEIKGEDDKGATSITLSDHEAKNFKFEAKDKKNSYSIQKKQGHLVLETAGSETKGFNIGNSPWVQEFAFSLKPFILSSKKTYSFTIVDPKRLNSHKMVATKQYDEKIELNKKEIEAVRVKVTLAGMKKMFWSAALWYDKKTGAMLRYQANEGPHTPLTTITLSS